MLYLREDPAGKPVRYVFVSKLSSVSKDHWTTFLLTAYCNMRFAGLLERTHPRTHLRTRKALILGFLVSRYRSDVVERNSDFPNKANNIPTTISWFSEPMLNNQAAVNLGCTVQQGPVVRLEPHDTIIVLRRSPLSTCNEVCSLKPKVRTRPLRIWNSHTAIMSHVLMVCFYTRR